MPTETGRHRLYEKISHEWGEEHAAELMSHLPPVGWADVATKQDLTLLGSDLRAEMAGLNGKIDRQGDQLRAEMHKAFASQTRWMVGTLVAMTGIVSAVVNWLH